MIVRKVVCFDLVTFTVLVLHHMHWSHLSHKNILTHNDITCMSISRSHSTQAKKKKKKNLPSLLSYLNHPPPPFLLHHDLFTSDLISVPFPLFSPLALHLYFPDYCLYFCFCFLVGGTLATLIELWLP